MKTENLREKLLDGTITALSVDTCIFDAAGHRLEQGNLKHLEQFHSGAFSLIFPEMILKELLKHIEAKTDQARSSLRKSLAEIGNYWLVPEEKRNTVLTELLADKSPEEAAKARLNAFLKRCGATILLTKDYLDTEQLVSRYFEEQPPFQASKDKKHEFPDAIAMMTLDSWAKKQHRAVLVVTQDKGCQRYCEESPRLIAIDDLGQALSLIQERDNHRAQLCDSLVTQVKQGRFPNLLQYISYQVAESIDSIDWTPEASSAFYYDPEMGEIEVSNVEFDEKSQNPPFRPVDFSDDVLVLRTTIVVDIEATCYFSFSVKDGIDRDMVRIGDAAVSAHDQVTLDVLLTVENPDGDTPEFVGVELVPARREIDFGEVGPDYSDDYAEH